MHSLVAKMSYPDIIGDCPIEDIKAKFHNERQLAKKIEFAINYAGDANTIANNMSLPKEQAQKIYDNYMQGLSGIAKYQEYCKKAVVQKGYITINPLTGHKSYWWDWKACMYALRLYEEQNFEELRRFNNKVHFVHVIGNDGETRPVYLDNIMDFTDIKLVKKKLSDWKKRSVNFRIQGTGALCFKLALQYLWKYLKEHSLVGAVKLCIVAHDEFNIEVPENIAEEMGKVLTDCMKKGAAPFCTEVELGADAEINDYWVH